MTLNPDSTTGERLRAQPLRVGAPVVYLTNILAPYRLPVLTALDRAVGPLKILLSTAMEANRDWPVAWGALDVETQRNWSWKTNSRHAGETYVHVPYDTLPRLVKYRPRVVLTSELGARTIQAYLYRRLFRGSRLMICADLSEHTERDRGGLRRLVRRHLLRHADAVMVNGRSGRRYVELLGVPRERISIVPFATDRAAPEMLPVRTVADGVVRLIYVGALILRKGLTPFLEALLEWTRRHPKQKVEFSLAGDGPLREQIESLAPPENLRVRLLGRLPYENLPPVYADADIFVLPSLADSWGVVVNEAMQWGLPVLGSTGSQAVDELVEEGVHGWRFDPGSQDGLLAALDRALRTPIPRLRDMGMNARKRAAAITPESVAEQTAEIVRRLLESAGHANKR